MTGVIIIGDVGGEVAMVYPCPLPDSDCLWLTTSEPPGPAENEGALADVFGPGVFAVHARNERRRRLKEEIRQHLATHTVEEFAIALAKANKRILELEAEEPR